MGQMPIIQKKPIKKQVKKDKGSESKKGLKLKPNGGVGPVDKGLRESNSLTRPRPLDQII